MYGGHGKATMRNVFMNITYVSIAHNVIVTLINFAIIKM